MWMLWAVLTTAVVVFVLRFAWYGFLITVFWYQPDRVMTAERAENRREMKAHMRDAFPILGTAGLVIIAASFAIFGPRRSTMRVARRHGAPV